MPYLDWSRSSVAVPMTDLEFDLLGAGYAAGYGRALTSFAEYPVKVLTSRYRGHLYSALARGTEPPAPPGPFAGPPDWASTVMPRLAEHFLLLRELADEEPQRALARARDLFAECVALHHVMLLPAREAIADLLAVSRGLPGEAEGGGREMTALNAVTAIGTAMFRAAQRLAGDDVPELTDEQVIKIITDGACDGDGYGLAQPGWLDSAAYARRVHLLLRRFGVTRASLAVSHATATDRRDEAIADLTRRCPAGQRADLASRITAAQSGAELAEAHGPLMHARYLHELRHLVFSHGRGLSAAGQLNNPEDILHRRLDEIGQRVLSQNTLAVRRSAYLRNLTKPLPEPGKRGTVASHQVLPAEVVTRLGLGYSAARKRTGERDWRGIAAASGAGHGPVRVVRRQAHIGKLESGDIALVPDSGPQWGWLALAGIPLVIERGGLLGHAPAVARERGSCCVISGPGLSDLLSEGEMIKVSGDTGEVTW
jgi:hypothetical protein